MEQSQWIDVVSRNAMSVFATANQKQKSLFKKWTLAFACLAFFVIVVCVIFVALQELSVVPGCRIITNNLRIINKKKMCISPHILNFWLSANVRVNWKLFKQEYHSCQTLVN